MSETDPIYCGENALDRLIQYCQSRQPDRFLLVADQNTYAVLGRQVDVALRELDWDVRTVVLQGAEILADEKRIIEVLQRAGGESHVYVAVGSGTITDITRHASHYARDAFISIPTAPSMDAYASRGAALVLGGLKMTVPSHTPTAIFADIQTLCEAPHELIAAGFGDMVGKYIALADWRLAATLIDEPYSIDIARRARRALLDCVAHVKEIGRASAAGITRLMAGLLESGQCMAELGKSRPASGSEHLLSHFWEMQRLRERHSRMLHGAKVGVGTVLAAQRYEVVRSLTQQDVATRLTNASPPDREVELARIQTTFGPTAGLIIAEYEPFLAMLEKGFDTLRQRIGDSWVDIQAIAANVPSAQEIADLLVQVGAPSTPQAVGLRKNEVLQALEFSHYVRNRFTVNTIGQVLGVW